MRIVNYYTRYHNSSQAHLVVFFRIYEVFAVFRIVILLLLFAIFFLTIFFLWVDIFCDFFFYFYRVVFFFLIYLLFPLILHVDYLDWLSEYLFVNHNIEPIPHFKQFSLQHFFYFHGIFN
jgi:hypothetical protein